MCWHDELRRAFSWLRASSSTIWSKVLDAETCSQVNTNMFEFGMNYYFRDDFRFVSSYGRQFAPDGGNMNVWTLGVTYRLALPGRAWRRPVSSRRLITFERALAFAAGLLHCSLARREVSKGKHAHLPRRAGTATGHAQAQAVSQPDRRSFAGGRREEISRQLRPLPPVAAQVFRREW